MRKWWWNEGVHILSEVQHEVWTYDQIRHYRVHDNMPIFILKYKQKCHNITVRLQCYAVNCNSMGTAGTENILLPVSFSPV